MVWSSIQESQAAPDTYGGVAIHSVLEGLISLETSNGSHCAVVYKIIRAHFNGHLAEPLGKSVNFRRLCTSPWLFVKTCLVSPSFACGT